MTDFRALCAELVDAIDASRPYATPLLDRARAALAEPRPAADGELIELLAEMRRICFDVAPCDSDAITRAAELLEGHND